MLRPSLTRTCRDHWRRHCAQLGTTPLTRDEGLRGQPDARIFQAASVYSGETRLNELKERHCSELARQRRWGTGDGEWIEQHYDRSHSEAFARLFPGISGETPSESDVEALRSRLQKYYKPLDRDRNDNRAHRYEDRNHPARADAGLRAPVGIL